MFNILMDDVLREARVVFGGRVLQMIKNSLVWLLTVFVFAMISCYDQIVIRDDQMLSIWE